MVGWFMDRLTASSCYGDLAIRNSEFGILLVLEPRASFPIQWNYYVRRADDPQYRKQKMLRDGCTYGSRVADVRLKKEQVSLEENSIACNI